MRRYEMIFEHLNRIPRENLRICKNKVCACKGCAGKVGAKPITEYELNLYLSGKLQKV